MMKIEILKEKYAINERRKVLFNQLIDEIEYLKGFTSNLKIAIYGSHITSKDFPCDLDIIICGNLTEVGLNLQTNSFPKPIPTKNKDIQRKGNFRFNSECMDVIEIINGFNNNEENKKNNITIQNFIEIEIEN